ncbi:MAG: hypothetical protein K1000chlam3_00674 [Chlamydiae bacterium]|nr:hypothetical protein [Chlamydiota bacterium]
MKQESLAFRRERFKGFAYSRTEKDHADFDPMIAHIQLDWLLSKNIILSDEMAREIKESEFQGVDEECYFKEILARFGRS